jgi:iron complex outermembrane receptor protein
MRHHQFLLRRVLAATLLCGWAAAWSGLCATNDVPELRVEVEAPALTAAPAGGDAWAGGPALARVPGVAVRSQGQGSPQTDLNIRGNPFHAGGLLLAGATLRNPQTEHFQADLPIPGELLTPPELLTGLERFRAGSGHPAGSVALEFAPAFEGGVLTAGAGGGGQLFGRLLVGESLVATNGARAGAAGYCSWDRMTRTDGQPDNDLERVCGGGHVQYRTETFQADLLAAASRRVFGARGFYGASPDYPAEEEVRAWTAVAALSARPEPDTCWRGSLAWQRTEDQYWLNRTNRALYANDHTSQSVAGQIALRRPLTSGLALDARLDADWEWIDSRYAGTLPGAGLGNHERGHVSAALLPEWTCGRWRVAAGGSCDLFTDGPPAWLPAAGVTWSPGRGQSLFAACTEAVRRPSYTELNYESPDSLGNSGLERQRTRAWEAGWRGAWTDLACSLTLFAEDSREIVDWVRESADSRWTAVNLARVRNRGATLDASLALAPAVDLTLHALLLRKSCDPEPYASRYVLDYPEREIRLGLRARLLPGVAVRVWQGAARMADNAARSGGDCRFESGAEARWRLAAAPGLTLAVGVVNIWDRRFEVFPGQPEAGRRAYAAAELAW